MAEKLPLDEFLKTFEKVPRAAISLFIQDKNKAVLLTKRAIPPEKNTWHMPGSFILRGERIDACIRRILKLELGYAGNYSASLLSVFEDLERDPRGHVLDIVYKVEGMTKAKPKKTTETQEALYFQSLPENIGFNHGEVLHTLLHSARNN